MRRRSMLIIVVLVTLAVAAVVVYAGSLDSTGAPTAAGGQIYTLEQVYDRLNDGTAATKMTTFTEPSSGPGSTMHTLDEIMAKAPAKDDTNGAVPGEVLIGKTYWSLRTDGSGGSNWGLETGTAAAGNDVNGPDGAKTFNIPDGFYSGKTATANDSDLVAGNIKAGVNIFGVDGTLAGGAGVPKTGQTKCYNASGTEIACTGTGQDGEYQKGVSWPSPRFTDNTDGTVTDNLTGLMWMQNADAGNDCDGADTGIETWADALASAAACNSGGGYAGYTDWRLPNARELFSLIDFSQYNPALPSGYSTYFSGVQSDFYWTSTTYAGNTAEAWGVGLYYGYVAYGGKTGAIYVWPVRGGQ